jgi:hypothetical protein
MNGRIINKENKISNIPIVGRIKIGEKRLSEKTGKEYPVSLDYFKCDSKYCSEFYKVYEEKPSKIQIVFISDDISFVCPERYELRNSKGDLFGKGDGENYAVWNAKEKIYQKFKLSEHTDLLERSSKAAASPKGWERVLTLRFLIPKVKGIVGLWQFSTKADKGSIDSLRDTFDFVMHQAGTVTRILFDLTVEKVKSNKPDDVSTYPIIRLIPNVSDENLLLLKGYSESILQSIPYLNDESIKQIQAPEVKQIEQGDKGLFDYET